MRSQEVRMMCMPDSPEPTYGFIKAKGHQIVLGHALAKSEIVKTDRILLPGCFYQPECGVQSS